MKYCFDVNTTLPFLAFRGLRAIAEKNVGEANILDLSQGEPGYGFSPNVRSRQFFAFLNLLDIAFNNHRISNLFFRRKPSELSEIERVVEKTAFEYFHDQKAKELLKDWKEFLEELEHICDVQDLGLDRFGIYYELFKYSNLTGGRYPQPAGHPLLQATMAEEYSKSLGIMVKSHELIGIMGASHGIGAIFQGLGEEGIGFLQKGDTVAMTSPVYSPYNTIFEERGIEVLSLSVDPEEGSIIEEEAQKLKNSQKHIKAFILIDPNNPTGFPSSENFLHTIADICEIHNSIIITDEVYFPFFDGANASIIQIKNARKRTVRIDSLSKIERATGLRVGDIYVSDEANEYITHDILKGLFPEKYENVRNLFFLAKSPGGKNLGLFRHITGIPGPSVAMALSHIILGKPETKEYVHMLHEKVSMFYKTIGIPHKGNSYYGMIDIEKIENKKNSSLSIEEKLERIAEKGVVVMPANLFFSEDDRKRKDRKNMIRVSLPNLSLEDTEKAGNIIKEVLNS